jgi:hypothetical protein
MYPNFVVVTLLPRITVHMDILMRIIVIGSF